MTEVSALTVPAMSQPGLPHQAEPRCCVQQPRHPMGGLRRQVGHAGLLHQDDGPGLQDQPGCGVLHRGEAFSVARCWHCALTVFFWFRCCLLVYIMQVSRLPCRKCCSTVCVLQLGLRSRCEGNHSLRCRGVGRGPSVPTGVTASTRTPPGSLPAPAAAPSASSTPCSRRPTCKQHFSSGTSWLADLCCA